MTKAKAPMHRRAQAGRRLQKPRSSLRQLVALPEETYGADHVKNAMREVYDARDTEDHRQTNGDDVRNSSPSEREFNS